MNHAWLINDGVMNGSHFTIRHCCRPLCPRDLCVRGQLTASGFSFGHGAFSNSCMTSSFQPCHAQCAYWYPVWKNQQRRAVIGSVWEYAESFSWEKQTNDHTSKYGWIRFSKCFYYFLHYMCNDIRSIRLVFFSLHVPVCASWPIRNKRHSQQNAVHTFLGWMFVWWLVWQATVQNKTCACFAILTGRQLWTRSVMYVVIRRL